MWYICHYRFWGFGFWTSGTIMLWHRNESWGSGLTVRVRSFDGVLEIRTRVNEVYGTCGRFGCSIGTCGDVFQECQGNFLMSMKPQSRNQLGRRGVSFSNILPYMFHLNLCDSSRRLNLKNDSEAPTPCKP